LLLSSCAAKPAAAASVDLTCRAPALALIGAALANAGVCTVVL